MLIEKKERDVMWLDAVLFASARARGSVENGRSTASLGLPSLRLT